MRAKIAALFVQTDGCYFGKPGIDPWDEARDARRYVGKLPVVAHPPCKRWGRFFHGSTRKPHQFRLGEDQGTFACAMTSVRNYGGVLEHPAHSRAFKWFGLPIPDAGAGWSAPDAFGGRSCYVEQGQYGHESNKRTWLYAVGIEFPELNWSQGGQRLPQWMIDRYGYAKARKIGVVAMVGGKDKERIRDATPPPNSATSSWTWRAASTAWGWRSVTAWGASPEEWAGGMTDNSAPRRLFISFSGGETSALMTLLIIQRWGNLYDEIAIIFANTGQENEETLRFVDYCDRKLFTPLGYRVVYVEAIVHPGQRKSPTARVVTFKTAARNGEPFEAGIAKYGIPNSKFKDCTRTLKLRPLEAYLRDVLGWPKSSYDTAIGIRADELDRISSDRRSRRLVYPLAEWGYTKPMVNSFWRDQPDRLRLKGYQGNCKWCWKKSFRKHYTILRETPEAYDFPERMEATYGLLGPEFLKDPATRVSPLPEGYHRVFFRESKSVADLKREAANLPATFVPAPDDADVYVPFDPELDVGGGCEETCEVHADEDVGDEEECDLV